MSLILTIEVIMKNQDKLYAEFKVLWKEGIIKPKKWGFYNHDTTAMNEIRAWHKKRYKEILDSLMEVKEEYEEEWTIESSAAQQADWELEKLAPTIFKIIRAQGSIKEMEKDIERLMEELREKAESIAKGIFTYSENITGEFKKATRRMEELEKEYRENIEKLRREIREEEKERNKNLEGLFEAASQILRDELSTW